MVFRISSPPSMSAVPIDYGNTLFLGGAGKWLKIFPLDPEEGGRGILRDHDEIHIAWGLPKKSLVAGQNLRKFLPIQAVLLADIRLDQGEFYFAFGPGIRKGRPDPEKKEGAQERQERSLGLLGAKGQGSRAQGHGEGEEPRARQARGGHERASRQGHGYGAKRESQGACGPSRLEKSPAPSKNRKEAFQPAKRPKTERKRPP
jgi:hypothetical protein